MLYKLRECAEPWEVQAESVEYGASKSTDISNFYLLGGRMGEVVGSGSDGGREGGREGCIHTTTPSHWGRIPYLLSAHGYSAYMLEMAN